MADPAVIRVAARLSEDLTYLNGFACTHLTDPSSTTHFDYIKSDAGVLASYTDSVWSQCLSVHASYPDPTDSLARVNFLLWYPAQTFKLLTIKFDLLAYYAVETNTLSYYSNFDPSSLDSIGFTFEGYQGIIGTTTTYFGTTLSKTVGFLEMTPD